MIRIDPLVSQEPWSDFAEQMAAALPGWDISVPEEYDDDTALVIVVARPLRTAQRTPRLEMRVAREVARETAYIAAIAESAREDARRMVQNA